MMQKILAGIAVVVVLGIFVLYFGGFSNVLVNSEYQYDCERGYYVTGINIINGPVAYYDSNNTLLGSCKGMVPPNELQQCSKLREQVGACSATPKTVHNLKRRW